MSIKRTIAALIIFTGLSLTAAPLYYSQNFDSMGLTGTAAPAGWSMWLIDGDSGSLVVPTSAEMALAIATPFPLAVWNQTSPVTSWADQAANMGSTATDANRLLGTDPSGTRGSVLQLSLFNDSGVSISSINVSYQMKCMALGTPLDSATSEELPGYSFYFLDGSTWTHLGSLDLSNDSLNSVGNALGVLNFTTPVAAGDTMLFRWFDDNGATFSPDFAFAIDNVVVAVPEPSALSLLAVGVLAIIARRRKA
jgi:hypothetical protein